MICFEIKILRKKNRQSHQNMLILYCVFKMLTIKLPAFIIIMFLLLILSIGILIFYVM